MTTQERITEIIEESKKAGKTFSYCYTGKETALVTVENPERTSVVNGKLVAQFYTVKIHEGHILAENFI